jgi:thiol:disulfide interchange protein DsbD
MEKFKIGMGFPLLATALWLYSLTSRHFGQSGVLWFGMFLIIVALSAWIWGEFVQRGARGRGWAMALSLVLLAGGYGFTMERELDWRSPAARATAEGWSRSRSAGGIAWQNWNREDVQKARREGHPALVDFTADWCLICQANKKTSLDTIEVRERLEAIDGVAFEADYTLKNPEITEELQRFERAGVPLVLVYPADLDAAPIILPEVLTSGIVLDALDQAARSKAPPLSEAGSQISAQNCDVRFASPSPAGPQSLL